MVALAEAALAILVALFGVTGTPEEDDQLVAATWAASAIIAERDSYCGGVAVPLFERYPDGTVWVGVICSGPEEWATGITITDHTASFESHAP